MGSTTDEDLIIQFFHEVPNKGAALAAAVLYLLAGIVALVLTCRTRAWFMLMVTITAWLEMIGFGLRVYILSKPTLLIFINMQALLIITPVLLPIINYIAVGRLMRMGDASRLRFKPEWVARVFLASDILCLGLQGMGGGMVSSTSEKSRTNGTNLLLAGLFLQLAFFTAFTALTIYIHRSRTFGLREVSRLRPVFFCLYATIALLYTRNLFRVIEFTMGYDGYLATHEEYFYAFDFAMIFGCIILFCVFHFGFYLGEVSEETAVLPVRDDNSSSNNSRMRTDVEACKPHVSGSKDNKVMDAPV